jgi:hypothetical protein
MKNYITKDGVSDAALVKATREMYAALELAELHIIELYRAAAPLSNTVDSNRFAEANQVVAEIRASLAKARGEI